MDKQQLQSWFYYLKSNVPFVHTLISFMNIPQNIPLLLTFSATEIMQVKRKWSHTLTAMNAIMACTRAALPLR
jgi:hypothetical protein